MLPVVSIVSLSIIIAGIIAAIRFKKIGEAFYPFLILVWLASLNEILSCVLMLLDHGTMVNNNIYVLAEALLFTWLFKKLGLFNSRPSLFIILTVTLSITWIWENFFYGSINHLSSWFRIIYSFLIVLMSISILNELIISDINKPLEQTGSYLFKNPVLLICIGSIGYFTFKVLVEVFWLYGLSAGREFRIHVFHILMYVNLTANLIYALAILWVPPKRPYMTIY